MQPNGGNGVWQGSGAHRWRAAQPKLATIGLRQRLQFIASLAKLLENASGPTSQDVAMRRQADAPIRSIEQPHAERCFEFTDRF